jgi:organic radical activating enzyme
MISYEDKNKENWFLVSWTLSNKCNYKCSYCPENVHNGTTGHPNWDTVSKFIDNFNMPGKEICYRISGGEPTYWKYFICMAQKVKNKGHTFSFLTNGSQSVEYFKEINPYTDGMIISYHPEYANIRHIANVTNVMRCPVILNLMMVPKEFDELMQVAHELHKLSPTLAIWPKIILDKTSDPTHITNKPIGYTKEQLEIINNWPYFNNINDHRLHRGNILLDGEKITANELISQNLNRHEGWTCYGGLDMINIDMWGDMYRSDCQNGGPIGNIERYKLPVIPITCERNVCSCLSDIYLRKVRP